MWIQGILRYRSFVTVYPIRWTNCYYKQIFPWKSKQESFSRCDINSSVLGCKVDVQRISLRSNLAKELVHCIHTNAGVFSHKVDKSRVPALKEEELEENFVKGSGPGGQKVNKTACVCMLRHIPTGIIIKCQDERNLHKNREKARQMMISKLDEHYNGEMSVSAQLKRIQERKKLKAQQKSQKRKTMKKAWQEREGID